MIDLTPPLIAHAGVYELLNDGSIKQSASVQPGSFPLQSIENYLNRHAREQADQGFPSDVQLAARRRSTAKHGACVNDGNKNTTIYQGVVSMRVRGFPDCQEQEDFIQDVFRFADNLNLDVDALITQAEGDPGQDATVDELFSATMAILLEYLETRQLFAALAIAAAIPSTKQRPK